MVALFLVVVGTLDACGGGRPAGEGTESTTRIAGVVDGDFTAAAQWQQALLARAEESGGLDPGLVARLRRDLARYQRGEALRRPLP